MVYVYSQCFSPPIAQATYAGLGIVGRVSDPIIVCVCSDIVAPEVSSDGRAPNHVWSGSLCHVPVVGRVGVHVGVLRIAEEVVVYAVSSSLEDSIASLNSDGVVDYDVR